MPDPEFDTPKRRRWPKRLAWGSLILIGSIVVLRFAVGWFLEWRFDARVDALHRAGAPVTLADLVPPPVPDNENAATLYLSAFEQAGFEPDNEASRVLYRVGVEQPLSAAEAAEARRIVARAAEPIALLREAASRRACRFPEHRTSPENLYDDPAHARKLRSAADLLLTSIRVNQEYGKPDEVLQDCRALLAISRVYLCEMPSQAFVGRWWRDAKESAETALRGSEPSEASIRALMEAIGDLSDRTSLVNALKRERCFVIQECRLMIHHRRETFRRCNLYWSTWPMLTWDVAGPLAYVDAVRYLKEMDRVIVLAAVPYHARQEKWKPTDGIWFGCEMLNAPPWGAPFSCRVEPQTQLDVVLFDMSLSRVSCLKTGLALRLFRLARGAYPDTLDALVPEFLDKLPTDPFSGKPLVYRREGSGFVVYGVGLNGRDDGGATAKEKDGADDIVFRVTR